MKIVLTENDVKKILKRWAEDQYGMLVEIGFNIRYSTFGDAELYEIEEIAKDLEETHG